MTKWKEIINSVKKKSKLKIKCEHCDSEKIDIVQDDNDHVHYLCNACNTFGIYRYKNDNKHLQ